MKVALVSDLHGNRVALEAVLDDLPDVNAMVCAGDVVGYNPWPADCIAFLLDNDVPTVQGNHDRAVATDTGFGFNSMATAGVKYARQRLTETAIEWLGDLPRERQLFDDRLKVVHDHPEDQDRYTYPDQFGPELLGDEDVLVLGHTHVQHHETYDEGVVVNPGSVGQPRDGDPRAAYAVLDLEDLTVEERRVEYDIDRVERTVAEVGLPEQIGSRLRKGR